MRDDIAIARKNYKRLYHINQFATRIKLEKHKNLYLQELMEQRGIRGVQIADALRVSREERPVYQLPSALGEHFTLYGSAFCIR